MKAFPKKIYVAITHSGPDEFLQAEYSVNDLTEVGQERQVGEYQLVKVSTFVAEVVIKEK